MPGHSRAPDLIIDGWIAMSTEIRGKDEGIERRYIFDIAPIFLALLLAFIYSRPAPSFRGRPGKHSGPFSKSERVYYEHEEAEHFGLAGQGRPLGSEEHSVEQLASFDVAE